MNINQEENIGVKDFFTEFNTLKNTAYFESGFLKGVFSMADSFVRTTEYGVYIFDYSKKEVVYVSENITQWCGLQLSDINKKGYDYYLKYVCIEDLKMLVEINNAGFAFWNSLPEGACLNYVVSYDFRFGSLMVNQRYTPVILDGGKICMAVCVVSLSSSKASGNIVMTCTKNGYRYTYSMSLKKWIKSKKLFLSDKEAEIIRLSIQGFSTSEIAEKTLTGTETVKTHKKNIYRKLKVGSMTEAVRFAINHNLL